MSESHRVFKSLTQTKGLPTSVNVHFGFLKAIWIERVLKSEISWKSLPLFELWPPALYCDGHSVVSCGHLCFYLRWMFKHVVTATTKSFTWSFVWCTVEGLRVHVAAICNVAFGFCQKHERRPSGMSIVQLADVFWILHSGSELLCRLVSPGGFSPEANVYRICLFLALIVCLNVNTFTTWDVS